MCIPESRWRSHFVDRFLSRNQARAEVSEDVIGLGSYNKTLTVLYRIELPDEDEQDDDSLQESWTPRFRR
jgi:hypothetical protein